MDMNKFGPMLIGISIGLTLGYFISDQVMISYDNCKILERENQMLRDMIFDQQDPYRPDMKQQPKEVEGCEL